LSFFFCFFEFEVFFNILLVSANSGKRKTF